MKQLWKLLHKNLQLTSSSKTSSLERCGGERESFHGATNQGGAGESRISKEAQQEGEQSLEQLCYCSSWLPEKPQRWKLSVTFKDLEKSHWKISCRMSLKVHILDARLEHALQVEHGCRLRRTRGVLPSRYYGITQAIIPRCICVQWKHDWRLDLITNMWESPALYSCKSWLSSHF